MKRNCIILILIGILLTGCSTATPTPQVIIKEVTSTPVPVQPTDIPTETPEPTDIPTFEAELIVEYGGCPRINEIGSTAITYGVNGTLSTTTVSRCEVGLAIWTKKNDVQAGDVITINVTSNTRVKCQIKVKGNSLSTGDISSSLFDRTGTTKDMTCQATVPDWD